MGEDIPCSRSSKPWVPVVLRTCKGTVFTDSTTCGHQICNLQILPKLGRSGRGVQAVRRVKTESEQVTELSHAIDKGKV